MTGVARPAAPFLLGFDCLAPVSSQVARMAKAEGFMWCARYLENLTAAECALILGEGLGLALLTEAIVSIPLSASTGAQRGALAVRQAMALGAPRGVHITLDDESPHIGSDVPGHANAFTDAVRAGGYGSGTYVGAPEPLDAAELYALESDRYWRAGSLVPEPACGFCVLQLSPLDRTMFGGQRVDVDVTCLDFRGRALSMWWPS